MLLQETTPICERSSDIRLDKEAGIIHGVRLVGPESANGRVYPREVLEKALSRYDGVKMNLNHPEKYGDQPRTFEDRIAIARNPKLGHDGAIYGDVHYNRSHPWASTLEWWAENDSTGIGVSQNAEGTFRDRPDDKGRDIVDEISLVRHLDFVADPATASGLFESAHHPSQGLDQILHTFVRRGGRVSNEVTSLVEQLKKRLENPLSEEDEEMAETRKDTLTEATLAEFERSRPDLVKALEAKFGEAAKLQEKDAELKALKDQLDELKEAAELGNRREKIRKALAEAQVPKELISEVFVKQLEEAKTDEELKSIIDDRKSLMGTGNRLGGPTSASRDTLEGLSSGGFQVSDRKSFVEQLKSPI